MTGAQAVTELAVYLANVQWEVQVFKYEKQPGYVGEYIVVNSLPFAFGSPLSRNNILNLNVHVPDLNTGHVNSARLDELSGMVRHLVPLYNSNEDARELHLAHAEYSIVNDSNYMADIDGTHFVNFKISVTF